MGGCRDDWRRTSLSRESCAINDSLRFLAQELQAPLKLSPFFQQLRMIHDDLGMLKLPLWHILDGSFIVGERLVGVGVLSIEMLRDGEGNPVATGAWLELQYRMTSGRVGGIKTKMRGED